MSYQTYPNSTSGLPVTATYLSHNVVYIPVSYAPSAVAAPPMQNTNSTAISDNTAMVPAHTPLSTSPNAVAQASPVAQQQAFAQIPANHARGRTPTQPLQFVALARANDGSASDQPLPAQDTSPAIINSNREASSADPGQFVTLVPISALPTASNTSTKTYDIFIVPTPGKKRAFHRELQVGGHPIYTIERDKPHFKARQLNILDSQTRQYLAGVRLVHWRSHDSIALGDPYKNDGYVKLYQEPKFHYNGREFEWQRNLSNQTRTLVETSDDERVLAKWKVDEGIGTLKWMVAVEREFELWCLAAIFAMTEARPHYRGGSGAGGCRGGCSNGGGWTGCGSC